MTENLVMQNPVAHNLLLFQGDEIIITPLGGTTYTFPDGLQGDIQPCYGSDGTMYLALFSETATARYAALIDMAKWYAELVKVNASENIRLLLEKTQEQAHHGVFHPHPGGSARGMQRPGGQYGGDLRGLPQGQGHHRPTNALSRRNEGEHFRSLSLQALASKVLSVARPAQPPHVETTFTLTLPLEEPPTDAES